MDGFQPKDAFLSRNKELDADTALETLTIHGSLLDQAKG